MTGQSESTDDNDALERFERRIKEVRRIGAVCFVFAAGLLSACLYMGVVYRDGFLITPTILLGSVLVIYGVRFLRIATGLQERRWGSRRAMAEFPWWGIWTIAGLWMGVVALVLFSVVFPEPSKLTRFWKVACGVIGWGVVLASIFMILRERRYFASNEAKRICRQVGS